MPSSCAIKCQQIILRDYGIDVTEEELRNIAIEHGWYDEEGGVCMSNNGKLLGCFGIEYHHSQSNTLQDIQLELSNGHRVMVNVSLAILSGQIVEDRHHEAGHAVVVTNVVGGGNGYVDIINPATGQVNQRCELIKFETAWSNSRCYMLATTAQAQFMYDGIARKMKKK